MSFETIRFEVDPNAREGKDFFFANGREYVVFTNKNALRVYPEGLDIRPSEFFHLLQNFQPADRGLMEKLRRRVVPRLHLVDLEELKEVESTVEAAIRNPADPRNQVIIETWFSSPASEKNLRPLQAAKLVQVIPSKHDKRARAITLTELGRKTFRQAVPLWRKAQSRFESLNGKETSAQLRSVLKNLKPV